MVSPSFQARSQLVYFLLDDDLSWWRARAKVMVVEANRDACRECVARADEAIAAKDVPKARRLLQKAQKLDPTFDVNGKPSN